MGKADIITKEYMKNAEVFADVFNQFLYGGKQRILPGNLQEIDTTMLAVPYGAGDAGVPKQKFRDELKVLTGMTDGNAAYCVLGAEGHLNVHYAVPVKNGLYDFMQLSQQAGEAGKSHERQRKAEQEKKKNGTPDVKNIKNGCQPSGTEYLSRFWKTDQLLPVITVVIYWNAGEWDGPLNLREMYSTQDEEILQYAPDYHVNLIAPNQMTDAQIDKYRTSMREVMLYIKHSKDKKKLEEVMNKNERFRKMERDAVEVINNVTESKLKYPKGEEKVDMCQAIREMREESEQIGITRGITIGEARMKARIKKAEEKKQKAEAEKQKAEAEKQKAEAEKQKAEIGRKKAEVRIRELEFLLAGQAGERKEE